MRGGIGIGSSRKQMKIKNGPDDMKNQDARHESPQPIGAYLRERRVADNISLEEVSEATGITTAVLQGLENEERDLLPAEVYIRAFYQKYAAYLGVDSAEVRARYQEQPKALKKPGGRSAYSAGITLKGGGEDVFGTILNKIFLPLALLVLGVVLYWLYKKYLSPHDTLGFYREHYPSFRFLFPASPSDFFG